MADIDVERKGPSIWPWIIGLIVLALVIWALAELLGDDADDTADQVDVDPVGVVQPTDTAEGMGVAAMPQEADTYMQECTQPLPEDMEMGLQHEFTANCLDNLADALDAVIARDRVEDANVSARLSDLRDASQSLEESDATAATHSGTTREAFVSAADLIEALQQAGYTGVGTLQTEVPQVREAAESVDPDTQMLEQRDAVQQFFGEAGDAVRAMAESPSAR